MRRTVFAISVRVGTFVGASPHSRAQGAAAANVLWYRAPAANWNEALPVGNGRLAAMVFGGVRDERLQLNEDTVWAGQKLDRVNPKAAAALPEIRRLLFAGKPAEAEAIADKTIISVPRRMPPYQTLGDLSIHFQIDGEPSEYRRELSLDDAIARVRFRAGGVLYTREVLATAVDHVIAVRVSANRPGSIGLTAAMSRERDASARAEAPNLAILEGQALPASERHADEPRAGVRFAGVTRIATEGGRMRADGASVVVDGANAATLLIAAATTMREHEPLQAATRVLAAASGRPYDQIRAAHVADYQHFSKRADFHLNAAAPDLPTNERLARVKAGETDLALEALYFQFGRYLLISSSHKMVCYFLIENVETGTITGADHLAWFYGEKF